MLRQTAQLYDPMVERDTAAIRAAVSKLRETESSDDLLSAVTRFAVLAFCPSQHSKAALCAVIAAREVAADIGNHLDELITECAMYTADSRAPWSEPPIDSPPPFEDDQRGSIDEIRQAIEERDRLKGEMWLAKVLTLDDFPSRFFEASLLTLPGSEQGVVVAAAAWRIAQSVPREHWFATLRVAIAEWTHEGLYPQHAFEGTAAAADILRQLVAMYEAEGATPLAFQALALFDAAEAFREVAPEAYAAVIAHLSHHRTESVETMEVDAALDTPVYRLGRDYAAYLQSHAIRSRLLRQSHDASVLNRMVALAQHNLQHADSYEEWSFA
jgi:hypothetical protein